MLKREGACCATERLHFVGDDCDIAFTCHLDQGFKELLIAWVVTAFALDQFHPQRGMFAGVTVDVVFEMADGDLGAALRIVLIKKRNVVDINRVRQTNAILGFVGDLCQRQCTTSEAMRKRDHTVGGMVVLESHFQRVFVGHRAASGQEAMLQLRAGLTSGINQQFR